MVEFDMESSEFVDYSYFPGCSLAATAKENNLSLLEMCHRIGANLIEVEDWNCCGSSSAHTISPDIALDLAVRNLFLAPPDRPLVVACPNCILRLRQAHLELRTNEVKRFKYEKKWGRTYNTDLQIIHFFELLDNRDLSGISPDFSSSLAGLKFVPYYGCMLARPNTLRHEKNYYGVMERILSKTGAVPLTWAFSSRCCGTFLSVVKPELVTKAINKIVQGAREAGADCLVTACAMCHLNLEVRASLKDPVPTIHFSELLALALGVMDHQNWFSRHLVDPRPLLRQRALI
jgi:heterodisulfide reductase subunit B